MFLQLGHRVYHEKVYNGKEMLTVVGLRKDTVELEGDYSGGTHNVIQKDWLPLTGVKPHYRIVSAFPGTGKSYFVNRGMGSDYMPERYACDSDSSQFSKSIFPHNYILHIKRQTFTHKYIFVSSHKAVRDALVAEGMDFTLVYPDISLRKEYLQRYKDRGSSEDFIDMMCANWNEWIKEMMKQEGCEHIILKSGQYLYGTNLEETVLSPEYYEIDKL